MAAGRSELARSFARAENGPGAQEGPAAARPSSRGTKESSAERRQCDGAAIMRHGVDGDRASGAPAGDARSRGGPLYHQRRVSNRVTKRAGAAVSSAQRCQAGCRAGGSLRGSQGWRRVHSGAARGAAPAQPRDGRASAAVRAVGIAPAAQCRSVVRTGSGGAAEKLLTPSVPARLRRNIRV